MLGLIVVGLSVGLGTDVLATNFSGGWSAFTAGENGSITPLTGLALLSALGVAMVGSLFSSDGWNSVTFISGEIKDPQRNIPLSLSIGTFLVTALYVLANITYLSLLPNEGIAHAVENRVGTAAAQMIMGPTAVSVMAALIMVSTFGCINGYVLVGPRMYYAMAKEGVHLNVGDEAETLETAPTMFRTYHAGTSARSRTRRRRTRRFVPQGTGFGCRAKCRAS